jgi:serine/threonine protein kinase/tetratricopeptide (TPR) repeat protein
MSDETKKRFDNDETFVPTSTGAGAVVAAGVAAGTSGLSSDFPRLQKGRVIANRYEILELLGQGGMGAVYKAQDRELDRAVAIKTIRTDLADNPVVLQRFKQEIIVARQVTHKNVIRIYDLCEDAGLRFITMEYIQGEDLNKYVKRSGKLPTHEAVEIMLQVTRALEAAHGEGVIHRDLKPQNVIRQDNGRVLVMDFGLAHSAETESLTVAGTLLGTMRYMSPEQAQGRELDPRSDLFTLGIVFYELLTNKTPYEAESAVASLVKRSQQRAVPPADVDSTVPAVLSDIVRKCLEPRPADRYQSASEIVRDLEAWRGGASTTLQLPSSTTARLGPTPLPPTSRRMVAAGLVVVAVLIALAWIWRAHPTSVAPAKPITILIADFSNHTSDSVFEGTLEPALSVAMEGASFISSYSRNQAHKIGTQLRPGSTAIDESLGQLVAAREGINLVLSGSIESSGSQYTLKVKAVDATDGHEIATETAQVSDKSGVLPAVNSIADRLRRDLGDQHISRSLETETYTASSLEAAHEYAQGQIAAQQSGKYEDAIDHYQKAIRLDPSMGRAYAGLAVVYQNQGKRDLAEENYKLALQRMDRMTDREKYRTRGGYYLTARKPQRAFDEMTALVKAYPSDSVGIANLALAYFYRRDMNAALEYGRKSIEIFPKNVPQRNNVGLYAMYAGQFEAAVQEQRAVLDLNPAYPTAFVGMGLSQLALDQPDAATETFKKLAALNPGSASIASLALADIELYQGRTSQAMTTLTAGIGADVASGDKGAAALKHLAMGDALLSLGRLPQAFSEAQTAKSLSNDDAVVIAAARTFVAAGKSDEAAKIAKALSGRLEADPQAYAKIIEGEISLKTGKIPDAVRAFQDAQKISDTWLGHFDLGRGYVEAKAYTEADSQFEICVKRRGEATALFLDESPTFHLYPLVLYYRGRAQEGLGSPSATQSYKAFLAIKDKGDADPMIQDARKRTLSQ